MISFLTLYGDLNNFTSSPILCCQVLDCWKSQAKAVSILVIIPHGVGDTTSSSLMTSSNFELHLDEATLQAIGLNLVDDIIITNYK